MTQTARRVVPLGLQVTVALALAAAGVLAWAKGSSKPTARPVPNLGDAALLEVVSLELNRGSAVDVMAYMKSPDAAVRARAALALARLQDWTVAPDLVTYLADPDPGVRKATAFALGEMDVVMPLLVTQIKAGKKGDEPLVTGPALARAAAEKKLDARLHLEERPDVRQALYQGLGPLAIGAGLHHLQFGLEAHEDQTDEAAWAARALGIHGYRRRTEAVQDKEIMEALKKLLGARSPDTRFAATYALFRLNCPEVTALMERLHGDTDARVRLYAARALSGKTGAEDALVDALKDPDWRVQVEALRALGEAPKPRGVNSMTDLAAMGRVGAEAARALVNSADNASGPLAHVVITAAGVLAKGSPANVTPLLEALNLALAGPKGPTGSSAPAMVASVRKAEELTAPRCAVAQALDVVSGGPSRVLTCGAAAEPAERGPRRALDVLAAVAAGDGERARRMSAFLHHPNAHVRLKAAEELGALDPVRAPDVGGLLAEQLAVETDPGAAFALADGLKSRMGNTHGAALRAALTRFSTGAGDNAEALVPILDALSAAHAVDAVTLISPLIKSPSLRTRQAALRTLVALGGKPEALKPASVLTAPAAAQLPTRATLKTGRGDVVLRFYREDAPVTVASFVELARKGFYKGLTFHRVVSDFVVQGGDPRGDGFGGPGYQIPCEYNSRPYERGVLGMALSGKDSGGSQFFITQSPQPHLDGQYTAFGEVESGMDVVDSLMVDDVIVDVMVL